MRLLLLSKEPEIKETSVDLEKTGYQVIICSSVIAATALVEEISPRVVVFDPGIRGARDFIRWLKKETGCMAIAVFAQTADEEHIATGIDGYVVKPLSAAKITAALESLGVTDGAKPAEDKQEIEGFWDITNDIRETFQSTEKEGWAQDDHRCVVSNFVPPPVMSQEVVSFWGLKGGVGRTTLSLLLSNYLSSFEVLLIDLNFKEGPGDVNALLDLPAAPHIGRLLDARDDRRKGFMESLVKPKTGNFAIVQPPPTIDQAEQISPEDIIELIDQARRSFQIILIDLPADISLVTMEAVDMSTMVLFVSDTHIGSLTRIEHLKTYVRKDINKSLVLNKWDQRSSKAREIAYCLDMPLAASIPTSSSIKPRENRGKILKNCDSIMDEGIGQLSKAVFGIEKPTEQKKGSLVRLIKSAVSNTIG